MTELPTWAQTLAVFDTETTGVDVETARIVTATVALLDAQGAVLERHDWVIDPQIEIPAAAAAVHGITTEVARETGMQPEVGVAQIIETLNNMFSRGYAVTAYNAPYDFTILAREAARYGIAPLTDPSPVLDPLILDKQFDRYRRGKRTLTATIEQYGVTMGQAHDAGEDAIAAGRLVQQIAKKFASLLPQEAAEVHQSQITWCAEQTANFEDWMRRTSNPSFSADGSWPIRRGVS